jgi:glutamyl-tRNA synthetase
MSVRTRIAPSPTGYMHIGTLRTALFDYFLARQHNGQFIIRIEDTDRERLVPGAVESLLRTFKTLGIEHDEGPVLLPDGKLGEKGAYGPYVQSERLSLYKKYVDELVDNGHAYHCFCTKERLEAMRAEQQATKQTPKYDRLCAKLTSDEVATRLGRGENFVVRMRIPEGKTAFDDAIRGHIEFDNRDVDDQVILKADGFPTYHLAVIVDDHLMKITHIIRGEEWLSSTPKHIILYDMFGWDKPVFAHAPLLLNPDRSKLSKRQGDVAVEDYLKRGYLVRTLINFVGTLGFNPKADQEIYSVAELIAHFDLSRVNKAGAVLNMEKLDWMNNQYLQTLTIDELADAAAPFVQADVHSDLVRRALFVERARVNRLDELQTKIDPYLQLPSYDTSMLVWRKADAADAKAQLTRMAQLITGLLEADFVAPAALEAKVIQFIKEQSLQNGNVLWPLRVALSGQEKSATPFEFLWALGRDEALVRINRALNLL